ncbi:carbohydrate-binding module family 14 protein [Rubellimicrobium sp. CFH 75288]|uniref:carbohydrate-binding module family 14 protein n=1 Tax=Rubellimicrobium sp. CFH 75288 TaxID=2697034 RepID=UPI001413429C|nr:carbohydrate-binding module family 14 protein [Rubellimicrobium sp. CFH 75288]NAZ35554.1 hypothetical protein [Rubellimicrobium sp. CFH 75288]
MKRVAFVLLLSMAPLSAWAAGCTRGQEQAMTCAEGTVWDPQTATCVPVVTG